MRLDTALKGRWYARRLLRKLERAGERCRIDRPPTSGLMLGALSKMFRKGTRAAQAGFAATLQDYAAVRRCCAPGEAAKLYEGMEAKLIERR